MAKVSAFKGWRYNQDIVGDLKNVIVPPYDVITPKEQNEYYDASPYNYIRINLNKADGDEKYFSAANTLNMWVGSGVLIEESHPAIYILSQSFLVGGNLVERIGCICALTLSELGDEVLPHEQTIDKHLDDRYKLMNSISANSGQIFMIYDDEKMILENINKSMADKPVINTELDKIRYRVWAVKDENLIGQFISTLKDKKLVIADGHHRYKTALKYAKNNPISGSEKVMVTLVNSKNPGMEILPTHRLIKENDLSISDIKKKLEKDFTYEECNGIDQLLKNMKNQAVEKCTLGLYHKSSNTGLILNFISWDVLESEIPDKSKKLRQLDTNILHSFLLKNIFDIDTNNQGDLKYLSYLRGNNLASQMLKTEDYKIVCFVNPPSIDDVFDIAENGEVMPQKSTFFFPKVFSGLVTRCF